MAGASKRKTRSVGKAKSAARSTSARSRARRQPERRRRAKPGVRGSGRFFRVELRPSTEFVSFRYHDVGRKGGIERIAGLRPNGRWLTAGWLISKDMAHVNHGWLESDTRDARTVIARLGSRPRHVVGDRFVAKPRPTRRSSARRRPQARNSRKPQTARRRWRR